MTPTLLVWFQLTGILALEITVLAGLTALLQRFTESAQWRRTLWQACLTAVIALVTVEFTGVARQVPVWHGNPRRPAPAAASSDAQATAKVNAAFRSRVLQRAALEKASVKPAVAATDFREVGVPSPAHRQTAAAAPPGARADASTDDSVAILAFELVWALGTAVVLGRAVFCRVLFVLLRHKWRRVDDGPLTRRVEELARRLGMRRKIRVIEAEWFVSPAAFGVVRPSIGLPPGFAVKSGRSQQDAMLLHELAHLWVRDPAWHVVADAVAAVCWWHPLSWWMRGRLLAASEAAADEASLLMSDGPGVLAECLVALGSSLTRRRPFASLGMAGTGFRSGLGRRVERLVHLNGGTWSPPCPKRSALARWTAPLALVTASVLCVAWVVPPALTKGENMQTMRQTWKKSLAAFTLLAAVGTGNHNTLAENSPPTPTSDEGMVLTATGPVITRTTTLSPTPGAPTVELTASEMTIENRKSMGAMAKSDISKERQAIEAKLEKITLDNVVYKGLPLGEVIRNLVEMSATRDPDKAGVNFVLNREAQQPVSFPIVSATGLPEAAAMMDLASVSINLDPPLKHVRLIDVLNAITKVSDSPIHYSIEDYGVVFSFDPTRPGNPFAMPAPAQETLTVRTFKVDTNSFVAGLDAAFGIKLPPGAAHQSHETQDALRKLLQQLGINLDVPNKSIFYNQLTGILMVRGTQDDLQVVQAAIETLGGSVYEPAAGGMTVNLAPGMIPGSR